MANGIGDNGNGASGADVGMPPGEDGPVEREGRFNRTLVPIFIGPDAGITDVRVLELKCVLRPDEVADILRVSVSKVYELCADGTLRYIKVRHSTRIKTDSVRHMLGMGRRP